MTTTNTILAQIDAATSPQVPANENFAALSAAGIFARRAAVTIGLVWGYFGGIYSGNNIDDGTVALTNTATNYVSVLRSSGVVSVATTTTNWDSALYARLYKVTVAGGVVTAYEDHRQNTNGLLLTPLSSVGRHCIPVMAGAMQPNVTAGCQSLATAASGAGQPDYAVLWFDSSTQEYAQFAIPMPSSWNRGTVTFAPIWLHPATATNFGAVWSLRAVAVSNDDTIGVGFGTIQKSTDTGGTTIDLYEGPESSAITIAGTPVSGDVVFFEISRVTGDAGDTLAVDAGLIGIKLFITTETGVDA